VTEGLESQAMTEDNKTLKSDIFIARSVYPDPESVFTTRYDKLESIKDKCIVVLDTNTLLVPYTVTKQSLDKIKETYEGLIKLRRLVIPAQVAREFAKNRANKIMELFDQLSKKRNSSTLLKKEEYPLLDGLAEYKASLALEDQINEQIKTYRDTLGKVLDQVRAWTWDDPVSVLYGELFAQGVVREIAIDDEATLTDLRRRQLHKIPPAYKDSSKQDEGVGDLIIWQTILEIGRTEKQSVVFVSHDEKSDWWHRSNDQALYPRYELIDEFRRLSGGQTFHIVQLSRFLDLFGATQTVVDEVKEKESRIQEDVATEDEEEAKVIQAFARSKFLRRSVSGIAKDAGIDKAKCQRILLSLKERGLVSSVRMSKENGGGIRWIIKKQ
jgi:hypothetical protein